MSSPYIGEIRMFAGNFAPQNWASCDGQTLPIANNDVLFNLIGTTYGGDGQETFQLPNLAGRLPLHQGTGSSGTPYTLGQAAGTPSVTLTTQQIPAHSHSWMASTAAATSNSPSGNVPASPAAVSLYKNTGTPATAMTPAASDPSGGNQPHDNMQPYLSLKFIISLYGIYPSPT